MNRLLIILLVIICFAHAIEFSQRIQALGTDFAYLVPDFETDIYRNPQLLGEGLIGIIYEPQPRDIYYRLIYAPPYVANISLPYSYPPLTLICLSKRFGIYGKYWPSYSYDLSPSSYGWNSLTSYSFRFQDLWMFKIKKLVLNIYNDGYFSKIEYLNSNNSNSLDKRFSYLFKVQYAFNIGKFYDLDIKVGAGFYERTTQTDYYDTYNQQIKIPTAQISLFYRNSPFANKFTSWYISLGGPVSTTEIDSLPHSIYSNLSENEHETIFFANTFMSKCGWATGLPINDKSFVAIGISEDFTYQKANEESMANDLQAINNEISLPVGIEYNIKQISIRLGAKLNYVVESIQEWQTDTLVNEEINHIVNYNYSFGIGWQPNEHFVIDLYNNSDLANLRNWSIYFKYLF